MGWPIKICPPVGNAIFDTQTNIVICPHDAVDIWIEKASPLPRYSYGTTTVLPDPRPHTVPQNCDGSCEIIVKQENPCSQEGVKICHAFGCNALARGFGLCHKRSHAPPDDPTLHEDIPIISTPIAPSNDGIVVFTSRQTHVYKTDKHVTSGNVKEGNHRIDHTKIATQEWRQIDHDTIPHETMAKILTHVEIIDDPAPFPLEWSKDVIRQSSSTTYCVKPDSAASHITVDRNGAQCFKRSGDEQETLIPWPTAVTLGTKQDCPHAWSESKHQIPITDIQDPVWPIAMITQIGITVIQTRGKCSHPLPEQEIIQTSRKLPFLAM